jgi:hypothetical protein
MPTQSWFRRLYGAVLCEAVMCSMLFTVVAGRLDESCLNEIVHNGLMRNLF